MPASSAKLFPAIMRRLYRVIAFAYYHYRPQYDAFEVCSGLHHARDQRLQTGPPLTRAAARACDAGHAGKVPLAPTVRKVLRAVPPAPRPNHPADVMNERAIAVLAVHAMPMKTNCTLFSVCVVCGSMQGNLQWPTPAPPRRVMRARARACVPHKETDVRIRAVSGDGGKVRSMNERISSYTTNMIDDCGSVHCPHAPRPTPAGSTG